MQLNIATTLKNSQKPQKNDSASHDVSGCASARDILALVGDKWSMLIVILLGDGTLRFNELKRQTGGITQRMLSLTLKGLERDGLILRHVTPVVPPQVDYTLTPLGYSLWALVKSLGQWASEHHSKIETARLIYDRRPTEGLRLVA